MDKKQKLDPVCFLHGKKMSEHEHGICLYCCLCFKTLTLEECNPLPDGKFEDVCVPCAKMEQEIRFNKETKEDA